MGVLPSCAGRNFGLALDRRCDGIDDFRRYLDFVFRAWLGSVVLGGDLSDLEKKITLIFKSSFTPKVLLSLEFLAVIPDLSWSQINFNAQ